MTLFSKAIPKRNNLIPASAGIGLRAQHYQDIIATKPDIGWLEVHSENYFGEGGRPHYYLEKIRGDYPLSLHGVGLSIGSADPLNYRHLEKLKSLIQRYKPGLVSEHLSWGSVEGRYLNDLLPLPYDTDTLQHVVSRVEEVQDYLGHQVLIENVSSYLCFSNSTFTEWEFLSELAEHSGCAILLDINNIYVSAFNHGFNASTYIQSIPTHHVKEIHLAGHTKNRYKDVEILIDSHDQRICDDVWALYREAACIFTDVPVLIEWDSDIPPLGLLLKEAQNADNIRQGALHENVASIAG